MKLTWYKILKITVFWGVTPCTLVEVWRSFGKKCCLSLRNSAFLRNVGEFLSDYTALHPEDSFLNTLRHKCLRYHVQVLLWKLNISWGFRDIRVLCLLRPWRWTQNVLRNEGELLPDYSESLLSRWHFFIETFLTVMLKGRRENEDVCEWRAEEKICNLREWTKEEDGPSCVVRSFMIDRVYYSPPHY
jgi:hypothetical protein